jgi:hypothetical protein
MDQLATMVNGSGEALQSNACWRVSAAAMGGKFVILVEDGDADNPPDREGCGFFR